MSEPRKISETAAARIQAEVRLVLQRAMLDLVKQARKDPDFMGYMPPEVWNERVDSIGADVVNAALNVAWKDWNDE